MKRITKLAVAGALSVGVLAIAQDLPGYTRWWRSSQIAQSQSAPNNPLLADGGTPNYPQLCVPDAGALIDSQYAYRISVCAQPGAVLDGGSLQMWLLDTDRCRWMRNPSADETITGGQRCQQFPDRRTGVAVGAMYPACNNVGLLAAGDAGVAAGTNVNDGGTLCDVAVKQFMWRGTGSGR